MSIHHEADNLYINRSRSNSFEATAARRMEQGQHVDLTRTSSIVSETIAEDDEDGGDDKVVLGTKDNVDSKKPTTDLDAQYMITMPSIIAQLDTVQLATLQLATRMEKAAKRLDANAKVMQEAAEIMKKAAEILEKAAGEEEKSKGKAVADDGENKEKATSKDDGSKGNEKPVGGNDRVWY